MNVKRLIEYYEADIVYLMKKASERELCKCEKDELGFLLKEKHDLIKSQDIE